MGVGIVASIAFEAERDTGCARWMRAPCSASTWTKLAVRRGSYMRGYVYAFIESFAPTLNRAVSDEPGSESYDI
jgi:LysR family cys regulon transcriptional activator